MFNTTHHHHHKNDTIIRFPDRIDVHEHKAPTDESVRLMEEMHQKAVQNIVAHADVKDNLITGQCWAIHRPWLHHNLQMVFKFKINGKEFNVEKELNTHDINWDDQQDIRQVAAAFLQDYSVSIMTWYALKMLSKELFEDITKRPLPRQMLDGLLLR